MSKSTLEKATVKQPNPQGSKPSRYQVIEHKYDPVLGFTLVRVMDTVTVKVDGPVTFPPKQVKVIGAGMSKQDPTDADNPAEGYKFARRRAIKDALKQKRELQAGMTIKLC
jgi:hypothetical protein